MPSVTLSLISVSSFPKSIKEMIKPKFSFCMFRIYICCYNYKYIEHTYCWIYWQYSGWITQKKVYLYIYIHIHMYLYNVIINSSPAFILIFSGASIHLHQYFPMHFLFFISEFLFVMGKIKTYLFSIIFSTLHRHFSSVSVRHRHF